MVLLGDVNTPHKKLDHCDPPDDQVVQNINNMFSLLTVAQIITVPLTKSKNTDTICDSHHLQVEYSWLIYLF